MIILGIDPGTATTGYGLVKIKNRKLKMNYPSLKRRGIPSGASSFGGSHPHPKGRGVPAAKIKNNLKCLDYGLIKTSPSLVTPDRLKKINNELTKIIKKYQPEIIAVENIYFFKNLKTAIPVSQAKGVILLTAAKKKIPVEEFTPLQMKSIITKNGWAKKSEVQKRIKKLLKLKKVPKPDDASDALGIAICGALKCAKKI